jgi:large subunit ribosomal protein L13
MKTYSPKASELERNWWVIDAEGQVLGRLASAVATRLRGKDKPTFAPHMDGGDFVVVVNAAKVRVTGRKLEQKLYYRHSGYPGGLRATPLGEMLAKRPERAIELAVRGMLPKNALGHQLLGKLKVYAGPDHPHAAQKPQVWTLGPETVGGQQG